MTIRSVLPALGAALALTGCYTYQPFSIAEPVSGMRVSVQLTDAGTRALANQVGSGILHLEGHLLGADSAALDLSVRQAEDLRGLTTPWNGERVAVPRTMIAGVQRRQLSVGGSALLGGAVATALVLMHRIIADGVLSGHTGSGNPRPQQ